MKTLSHSTPRTSRKRKGFAIMEALLAVGICGVMATGIVMAMHQVAKLSFEAKREAALSRIIYNQLQFEATKPRIRTGKSTVRVEEWDVEIETEIVPLEGLVNQEGQNVDGMLHVIVRAVWWGDGDYENMSAETWRNPYLYAN